MAVSATLSGGAPRTVRLPGSEVDRLRIALTRVQRLLRTTTPSEGLTPSQVAVLGSLCRSGGVRMSELAATEAINPTMLSRITGRLENLGLVVRTPDPDDRRAASVAPTPAGRRTQQRLQQARSSALDAQLVRLDESELRALRGALPALEALAAGLGELR